MEFTIIACIDMDAFYAQVESKALGLSNDVPLATRQWNSLIAVNYAARKFGVTRFTHNATKAQQLCPQIHLPHVDTIKINDQGQIIKSDLSTKYCQHNPLEEKVSLERYRKESKEIFKIISGYCKLIEKASIDECFLDLSQQCIKAMKNPETCPWFEPEKLETQEISENNLLKVAGMLVQEVRNQILKQTQYTSSAGISYNKMLAKLASSLQKPFAQSTIYRETTIEQIRHLKISKLRNFGGKVNDCFAKQKIEFIDQALDYSQKELEELFKDKAQAHYVYKRLRGYDDEIVKWSQDFSNKSLLSIKQFKPIYSMKELQPLIQLIIADLALRVSEVIDNLLQVPNVFSIQYYDPQIKANKNKSQSIQLNIENVETLRASIEQKANLLLAELSLNFPQTNLSMSFKSFQKIENKTPQLTLEEAFNNMERRSKQKTEQASEGVFMSCTKCNKKIAIAEQQSHEDWHVATQIDKELNPNKKKYRSEQLQKKSIV